MIAIKGMEELPKNCAECPMYNSDVDDYCDITGEWITGEEMVRHKDCPLVEIVTCKDCTYDGCAKAHSPNHWCADGERRE
jgi:hypothetical protein